MNNVYTFMHKIKPVEVGPHQDEDTAKEAFQARFGYWPTDPIKVEAVHPDDHLHHRGHRDQRRRLELTLYSVYLDDPDERCGPGELGLHGFVTITDAQAAAEAHWGGSLIWRSGNYGRVSESNYDQRAYVIELD